MVLQYVKIDIFKFTESILFKRYITLSYPISKNTLQQSSWDRKYKIGLTCNIFFIMTRKKLIVLKVEGKKSTLQKNGV